MTFDPRFDIPETDEQVTLCIKQYYESESTKMTAIHLYQCYREQGYNVTNAWRKMLLVAVGDKEEANKIVVGEQENPQ